LEEVRSLIPTGESVRAAYDPQKETYKSNTHYRWVFPDET
jgi:hypothetical protein